jgi:two-component system chemotaxis response regulator CheY
MLIDIINHDAEKALLSLLEKANRQNIAGGALHFRCSRLEVTPGEEDFLLTIRPVLTDKSAAVYFFKNGDVVVTWKGMQKTTLEDLCHRLYERYAPTAAEKLHAYFDLQAQGEELRLLCKRGMAHTSAAEKKSVSMPPSSQSGQLLKFSDKQIALFRTAVLARKRRDKLEMLVVEDQAFSNRLLVNMLNQNHRTHAAVNAVQAMEYYCDHAPDIVFLDIELPDLDGHHLAAMIRSLDPQAYIVMVTGNNYAQDVLRAKENDVKGFIAKPYNKLKIDGSIEKFLQERSK